MALSVPLPALSVPCSHVAMQHGVPSSTLAVLNGYLRVPQGYSMGGRAYRLRLKRVAMLGGTPAVLRRYSGGTSGPRVLCEYYLAQQGPPQVKPTARGVPHSNEHIAYDGAGTD